MNLAPTGRQIAPRLQLQRRQCPSCARPCSAPRALPADGDVQTIATLQHCIAAHHAISELQVPHVVSGAWGETNRQRCRQACESPVYLPGTNCEVVLVGIFHRCFSNAAILHDVLQHLGAPGSTETTSSTSSSTPASSSGPLAGVDAIAVEARHSFLPTYARIARGMPRALQRRLQHVPLGDLREALEHVDLDVRIEWHTELAKLATAESSRAARASAQAWAAGRARSRTPHASDADGKAAAPDTAAEAAAAVECMLAPSRLLSAFLARELVLCEKVAAAHTAHELGVPLHGIELDDPARYAALMEGPLTAGMGPGSSSSSGPGRSSPGTSADGRAAGQGGENATPAGELLLSLEERQRRLALRLLPPHVSEAFLQWFKEVPQSSVEQVLTMQLAALTQQCMAPPTYASFVEGMERQWVEQAERQRRGGEGAAAAAMARQHQMLTALREQHFVARLQQVAAGGAAGGGPCRRIVVLLGRGHEHRLRQLLGGQAQGQGQGHSQQRQAPRRAGAGV